MKRVFVLFFLLISTWMGLSVFSAPVEDPPTYSTMGCEHDGAQDPDLCTQ